MLCYNVYENKFFNTSNEEYKHCLDICECTKGVDNSIVIESWYIPDKQETVLFKRSDNTLFESKHNLDKIRTFYFDLQFKEDVTKVIKGIVIPPKLYSMFVSTCEHRK